MGKNKHLIIGMRFDEFDDIIKFLLMFYRQISMMDLIYRDSFPYLDKLITRDMLFDNRLHLIIHRCRKGKRLFNVFELGSNFFDITDKSHIKHSIYLIQDEVLCDTDIDDLLIHKIH